MRVEADVQFEREGSVAIATLSGELDALRATTLREALREAAEPDVVAVLVDLSGVTYLDSAGIHLLLELQHDLARRGYAMHLVRPGRRTPALVLDVTDLARAIDVHPDRGAALAAMEPPAI